MLCKASSLAWSRNIASKKIDAKNKQTPKMTTSQTLQFTMPPPIKATTQSQAPPRQATFTKPREQHHHVASTDKATIVHHLLKQSQPTTRNMNTTSTSTPHPQRIAFIYGALAQGNP
jgi:hypothetical protein